MCRRVSVCGVGVVRGRWGRVASAGLEWDRWVSGGLGWAWVVWVGVVVCCGVGVSWLSLVIGTSSSQSMERGLSRGPNTRKKVKVATMR